MLYMDFAKELMLAEVESRPEVTEYPNYESLKQAFEDEDFVNFVSRNLPRMVVEVERRGTMEVGKDRETALIVLLDVALGAQGEGYCPIEDEHIDPMEKEVDVRIFNRNVSIKTRKMTTKSVDLLPGYKATWSSDRKECDDYIAAFDPKYDVLYLPVQWGQSNFLYYFTEVAQQAALAELGREKFFRIGAGKDPKGVSVTDTAVRMMSQHPTTLKLPLTWPELNDEARTDKVEMRCHDVISKSFVTYTEERLMLAI